jgi:N-acetylglucosaminyldiphosphoundecaprenol N-acetyl-beta-D-mannosaminyltransferase
VSRVSSSRRSKGGRNPGLERPSRAYLFGCWIDRLDLKQTVERCDQAIARRECIQQVSVNALKVAMMRDDPAVRAAIREAGVVSADGAPVVWTSRLLGDPLPARVAGVDLMYGLLALCERRGYRPYILGARRDVLDRAVAAFRAAYPRLEFAGYRDGYFSEEDESVVTAELSSSRPDVLFIAMSSPAKEKWGRVGTSLGIPLSMGVGGSIDVAAGKTRRAPRWMQSTGLEWLFRTAQEPRRLAPRYASSNLTFLRMFLAEIIRHISGRRTPERM